MNALSSDWVSHIVRLIVIPDNACVNSSIFCATWRPQLWVLRFHDDSSTDISVYDTSFTDISSTTVYQRVAQLYCTSNFCFSKSLFSSIPTSIYTMIPFLSIPLPLTLLIIQHIQLANIVAWQSSLFFQLNTLIFINPTSSLGRISCINPASVDIIFISSFQLLFQQGKS